MVTSPYARQQPVSSAPTVRWPPHPQAMIDRCREDLALALASTEPDNVALLDGEDLQSFEALRGLLRRQ